MLNEVFICRTTHFWWENSLQPASIVLFYKYNKVQHIFIWCNSRKVSFAKWKKTFQWLYLIRLSFGFSINWRYDENILWLLLIWVIQPDAFDLEYAISTQPDIVIGWVGSSVSCMDFVCDAHYLHSLACHWMPAIGCMIKCEYFINMNLKVTRLNRYVQLELCIKMQHKTHYKKSIRKSWGIDEFK